jgi:general stress protein 26
MNANIFAKATQIIKNCDVAYLGVIDESGSPHVSTVSTIKPESIFEAYFATGLDANKTKRILADKRSSVCYRIGGDNISLTGEAEILTDGESKRRLWLDWFIDHFPGGVTDPNYCTIKFTAKRASLWIDNESAEFTMDELLTVQSSCGLLCKWCTYRKTHNCGGCIAMNGCPFWGECDVAKCCIAKGFSHCGECDECPCENLRGLSYGDDSENDRPEGARIEVCKAWAARKEL